MLEAVPYSSANILDTREICSEYGGTRLRFSCYQFHFSNVEEILTHAWSPGGMMREIMEVPLPLAASRDLISFLTWEGKNVRTLKIGNLSVIWGKLTYLPDFNILVGVLRILTHVDSGELVVVGGGVIEAGRKPPRTSQALKVHYLVKLVKCMVWLKSYIKALGRALWLVVMNFCIKWREKI